MEVVVMEHNREAIIDIKKPLLDHHHHDYNFDEHDEVEVEAEAPPEETDLQVTGTPRHHVTTEEAKGTINTDYDEREASLSSSRDTHDNSDKSEVKQSTHVLEFPTNVYFDNKQDAHVGNYLKGKDLDIDIQQVPTAVINANTESAGESSGQPENLQVDIVDEIHEEVIELEFERAVEKIHSHHGYEMYCPNCSTRVTKVVLRRRIVKKTPVKTDKPVDLLGCLSCFSVFVAAGNKLNPFRMFGWDKETKSSSVSSTQSSVQQQQQTSSISSATQFNDTTSTTITTSTQVKDTTSTITSSTHVKDTTSTITSSTQVKGSTSTGKSYGILSLFRKGRVQVNDTIDKTTDIQETLLGSTDGDRVQTYSLQGSEGDRDLIIDINKDSDGILKVLEEHRGRLGGEIEEIDVTEDQQQGADVHVLIGEEPVQTGTTQFTESIVVCKLPVTVTEETSSISLEVVKSIVYGGLMEIIASLSVVSSGAASGVTTMNILALGLANLVSGFIILGTNFRDMKYGENSESEEAVKRYKEILGRKEHFLIHAVVGVLSYIAFGLVPLVTYGFAFRESDDKDYKILAVAGSSLLCIIILAIMKAYTHGQHKFSAYLKTVVYYVTFAAAVSGVAYAVGDLASKLMERLGWWDSSPVNALFLKGTKSINPAFVSY